MKKRIVTAFIVLFVAVVAWSQEKITVHLVEVPVTVIDRGGNPVRGLTADNFQLLDDGKPQKIASIDAIDFAAQPAATAITPMNPYARRSFLILFDLGFSSPNILGRAQEAARRFVAGSVKPLDLVGVATIEPDRGFRLITSFTTDRELVASAIENPFTFRANDPLQLANVTRTFEPTHGDPMRETAPTGTIHDEVTRMADEYYRRLAVDNSKANEPFVRARIEKQVDALGQLAATLRAIPGRKQVIYLSEGFDPKYVRGRDVRDTRGELNDMVATENKEYWQIDSDDRYGNTTSQKFLAEMGKLFRSSDVVLHAIDIQGVRVLNDVQAGTRFNSNDALYLVARPTGGDVFANGNNLNDEFQKMLHQQEVVYVLSFYAPSSKPGKLHDLSVKLVNVPNGKASYRMAYYELGGEDATQRTLTNAEIVINDIAQDGVKMHAVAGAFAGSAANAQVPVVLEMNGSDLLKGAAGNPAVEIFLYAFDSEGTVRDRLYQKISLDVAKVGAKLNNTGVKYWGTLSLPPGTYAIKALVKTGDERRGFARADVVVPKAGELAVAPFFIDEKPSDWVLVKGTSHEQNAAYPFAVNGQNFVPGTVAKDGAGQSRKLAIIVRNAASDDLSIETTPKTRILGKSAAGDATQFVLELDAPTASPTMQVSVTKAGAPAAHVVVTMQ